MYEVASVGNGSYLSQSEFDSAEYGKPKPVLFESIETNPSPPSDQQPSVTKNHPSTAERLEENTAQEITEQLPQIESGRVSTEPRPDDSTGGDDTKPAEKPQLLPSIFRWNRANSDSAAASGRRMSFFQTLASSMLTPANEDEAAERREDTPHSQPSATLPGPSQATALVPESCFEVCPTHYV
jgi:hypothetical protein